MDEVERRGHNVQRLERRLILVLGESQVAFLEGTVPFVIVKNYKGKEKGRNACRR